MKYFKLEDRMRYNTNINIKMAEQQLLTIQNITKVSVFRFKLKDEIVAKINEFAKIHQFDDRKMYKENWSKWFNENNALFEEEIIRLTRLGYMGNVEYKMFNAGRYYFRNKKVENADDGNHQPHNEDIKHAVQKKKDTIPSPKKNSRLYISTDKAILEAMDNHIRLSINNTLYTPASGYNDFCKTHTSLLSEEIKRIYNTFDRLENISANEISPLIIQKIKKTYKNRYFIITRTTAGASVL